VGGDLGEGVRGQEPVRVELMEHFGFFVTESSGHASEYVPYFRKSARMVEEELVPRFKDEADHWFDFGRTGGYVRHCIEVLEESQEHYQRSPDGEADLPTERTHEYGSYIIEAIETNEPIRVNGNVPNAGLIEGLPRGCCVEVPCLVDTRRRPADGRGLLPSAARRAQPHQHQRAGAHRRSRPDG
jgi:alpha-galactosidase